MSRRPYRSELFLRFCRSMPCCVCGTRRGVEAAHIGPHGLGQKADDTSVIPLCVRHHRQGPHSLHRLGRWRFELLYGLDIAAIIRKLNEKPRISVCPLGNEPAGVGRGWYVANIGTDNYKLGSLEAGIDNALRKLAQIQHERLTDKIEENLHA